MYENYIYHQDFRYVNIYRCSKRAGNCTATLTVGENEEDLYAEGIYNHFPNPSAVEDSALRDEIKRLARETLDSSTDILRAASLL